jgi:hypothetical protein
LGNRRVLVDAYKYNTEYRALQNSIELKSVI